jgi:hypothetical protein
LTKSGPAVKRDGRQALSLMEGSGPDAELAGGNSSRALTITGAEGEHNLVSIWTAPVPAKASPD